MQDYYKLLNVDSSASLEEIRKAFKREASKWHPDRNSSPNATERMQLINEAYLILKDAEARVRYDKEYSRYKSFIKKNQFSSDYDQEPGEDRSQKNTEYVFDDELLSRWIKNARAQAAALARQSLDDLVGMSKAATKSAWDATKGYILVLIVLLVIMNLVGFF